MRESNEDKNEIAYQILSYVISFVLGWMVGAQACSGPNRARAQMVSVPERTLLLARLCVNESGTDAYMHDDCAVIHAVIAFRAEHIYHTDYITALHRYSNRATVTVDAVMPYIPDLQPDGRKPRHWPNGVSWERVHRNHWLRSLAHAGKVMQGEIVASCALPPHTWGAPSLIPNGTTGDRPELRPARCGRTLNRFWSVRRYARAWGPLARWGLLLQLR